MWCVTLQMCLWNAQQSEVWQLFCLYQDAICIHRILEILPTMACLASFEIWPSSNPGCKVTPMQILLRPSNFSLRAGTDWPLATSYPKIALTKPGFIQLAYAPPHSISLPIFQISWVISGVRHCQHGLMTSWRLCRCFSTVDGSQISINRMT